MTQKKKLNFLKIVFVGEHPVLASCVANKLQSDAGHSCVSANQKQTISGYTCFGIHAYDTRYLHNLMQLMRPRIPTLFSSMVNPTPEILSSAQRSENDKYVYAFALMLQRMMMQRLTHLTG